MCKYVTIKACGGVAVKLKAFLRLMMGGASEQLIAPPQKLKD
jgi:hypothetical protein